MKKTLLFLAAGAIAATAHAQQASRSIIVDHSLPRAEQLTNNSGLLRAGHYAGTQSQPGQTERTTTGPCTSCGRWYDYVDSIVGINGGLLNPLGFSTFDIWQDTTATFGYTGTTAYANSDFTSVGLLFHPWASAWNSAISFAAGEIAITPSDPYTIDSVVIAGTYHRNLAKPSIVDTLVVQFVWGNMDSTSNLPLGIYYPSGSSLDADYGIPMTDSIPFVSMLFDSVDNRAGASGAPLTLPYPVALPVTTPAVIKYPLTIADTNTSSTIGMLTTLYPRPGDPALSISLPPGNVAGVSVSFKSGDVLAPYPADTVRTSALAYKFGAWEPLIAYEGDGTAGDGNAVFPPYENLPVGADWTSGYFNEEGARDRGNDYAYAPNWGWTTSTGASILQYPYIWFHVKCPTCNTVGTASLGATTVAATNMIKVYPNPASDEVNISYTLVNSAEVTATLTNMLGQVVATQKAPNGAAGNMVFNTNALAEGMYIYTLEANGERTTGRIVVAH